MIHPRILQQAGLFVAIVQIVWALAGLTFLHEPILFVGRLVVAGGGGYLYGLYCGGTPSSCALGGTFVGALCVIPAVLLSVAFGDTPGSMVPMATGSATLAGGFGGAIGCWIQRWRQKDYKQRR